MTRTNRMLLMLASIAFSSACGSSTEPKSPDLTGFWTGTTTSGTSASDSRMMIVQTGTSVEGWYRWRSGIPSDQTDIVGSVNGDTLSVLINSGQVAFVGAVKFRILQGGEDLEATNNGNSLRFSIEQ